MPETTTAQHAEAAIDHIFRYRLPLNPASLIEVITTQEGGVNPEELQTYMGNRYGWRWNPDLSWLIE